jgi:hypothetical protein
MQHMKRWIITAAAVVCFASFSSAQSSGSTGSGTAGGQSRGAQTKNKKGTKKPSEVLDNRKVYRWKNGQRATPTGQEATSINGGYSAIKKDTGTVKQPARKKEQE